MSLLVHCTFGDDNLLDCSSGAKFYDVSKCVCRLYELINSNLAKLGDSVLGRLVGIRFYRDKKAPTRKIHTQNNRRLRGDDLPILEVMDNFSKFLHHNDEPDPKYRALVEALTELLDKEMQRLYSYHKQLGDSDLASGESQGDETADSTMSKAPSRSEEADVFLQSTNLRIQKLETELLAAQQSLEAHVYQKRNNTALQMLPILERCHLDLLKISSHWHGEAEFTMFFNRDRRYANILVTRDTDIIPISYKYKAQSANDIVVLSINRQIQKQNVQAYYDMLFVSVPGLDRETMIMLCILKGNDYTPPIFTLSCCKAILDGLANNYATVAALNNADAVVKNAFAGETLYDDYAEILTRLVFIMLLKWVEQHPKCSTIKPSIVKNDSTRNLAREMLVFNKKYISVVGWMFGYYRDGYDNPKFVDDLAGGGDDDSDNIMTMRNGFYYLLAKYLIQCKDKGFVSRCTKKCKFLHQIVLACSESSKRSYIGEYNDVPSKIRR